MSMFSHSDDSGAGASTAPPDGAAVPAWSWLLLPYAILLVAFLALPLANIFLMSIYRYSPIMIWEPHFTLENYGQLLTGYYATIALRTLRIGAASTALCVILGYPIAYYLARCSRRALTVGMFILILPLMVSAVVGAFGWIVILGRNGMLNHALEALGLGWQVDILYTETAVVIALVHFLLPLMVLPLMASIEKIPRELEEAATNLGAGPWGTFRLVILPISQPGLVSGVLLCFSVAISVVVTSALLGGRAGRMFGNELYEQVATSMNWPLASSLAVVLVLLIVACMMLAPVVARGPRRAT